MSKPVLIAIDAYVPRYGVDQRVLEAHLGVSAGKLTAGLGQEIMAFTTAEEDTLSLARNALQNLTLLLERSGLSHMLRQVRRLEVGTESNFDRSKSLKSSLVDLLPSSDLSGADCVNACIGGTIALHNSCSWLQAQPQGGDGLAIVVTSDIACYEKPNEMPTGGAGAVAMLLGMSSDTGDAGYAAICPESFTYSWKNCYDFYKPSVISDNPTVNGRLSINSYMSAALACCAAPCRGADVCCYHAPFSKMVEKAHACVYKAYLSDARVAPDAVAFADPACLKAYVVEAAADFAARVAPTLYLSKRVGNIYTGSLYLSLLSALTFLAQAAEQLPRSIAMFSYGSGYGACAFTVAYPARCKTLFRPADAILGDRVVVGSPDGVELFTRAVESRRLLLMYRLSHDPVYAVLHPSDASPGGAGEGADGSASYACAQPVSVRPGCWYLREVTSTLERVYARAK